MHHHSLNMLATSYRRVPDKLKFTWSLSIGTGAKTKSGVLFLALSCSDRKKAQKLNSCCIRTTNLIFSTHIDNDQVRHAYGCRHFFASYYIYMITIVRTSCFSCEAKTLTVD